MRLRKTNKTFRILSDGYWIKILSGSNVIYQQPLKSVPFSIPIDKNIIKWLINQTFKCEIDSFSIIFKKNEKILLQLPIENIIKQSKEIKIKQPRRK